MNICFGISDVVWQTLINSGFGCIGTGFAVYLTFRLNALKLKQDQNAGKIEQIHLATNSMKDALVKATADASSALGREEGRKAERSEFPTGRGERSNDPGG